jgi:hypothetical protein
MDGVCSSSLRSGVHCRREPNCGGIAVSSGMDGVDGAVGAPIVLLDPANQEGGAIGQRYAKGKEESLMKMLKPVLEKYGVK